jgi:superfamily II DNA or RNA helicase
MQLTWDSGTLLVSGSEPLHDIPGLVRDPRVGAWRAPAHLYGRVTDAIRLRGLPLVDRASGGGAPPAPFRSPELREYQQAALAAWDLAGRRGVVVLPTGAGKTKTALAAIARTGARALCLVPTRVLLEQWVTALKEAGVEPIGRYGDGDRVEAPITVATYASALRNVDRLGNRFDLLVVDEAHHFGGTSGDECLEMSTARWRLGLTATPPAGERLSGLERLVGHVVFEAQIADLAGRWLAPFRVMTLCLNLSPAEQAAWEAEGEVWRPVVRGFFDAVPGAQWADFVKWSQQSDAGRKALAAWTRGRVILRLPEAKRHAVAQLISQHAASRVLVFAPDAVAALQLSRENLVPVVTADIGRAERKRILDAFAAGKLRTIVSARVLNEGVDVPAANVAVVVGGSQGDREFVQRVGRVLRPAAGKEALVYELTARGTSEVQRAERRRMSLVSP